MYEDTIGKQTQRHNRKSNDTNRSGQESFLRTDLDGEIFYRRMIQRRVDLIKGKPEATFYIIYADIGTVVRIGYQYQRYTPNCFFYVIGHSHSMIQMNDIT